jgi:glycosidase
MEAQYKTEARAQRGAWYANAVIYHIFTFGLCNAPFNNDDASAENTKNRLAEVEKWIPHIEALGCDAVLFSPVFQSRTHGYDVTDYFRVDSRLGREEDLRSLVGRFHDLGIRVIFDAVFNHCGRDFFAFRDVRDKGRDSEYRDWISGLDFNANNRQGDGFSYDTWSGYEELVKLDLKNPAVTQYLLGVVKFWIETFDIDGLRLDAANVLDFDFMRKLRSATRELKPDFWLMGEVVAGDYGKWANENVLHSVTNYVLYKGLYSSHNDENLFELASTLERQFGDRGECRGLLLNSFVENHDQNRLASLVKQSAYLYTIYILLFTLPGIPSLYYGGEWGMKGEKRNGSDAQIRPTIDLRNVRKNEPDLEKTIRKLIEIRKGSIALKSGDYKQVFLQYRTPFVFERSAGDETVVVAVNPFPSVFTVDLRRYACRFTDLLNGETLEAQRGVTLHPHWGRILRKA